MNTLRYEIAALETALASAQSSIDEVVKREQEQYDRAEAAETALADATKERDVWVDDCNTALDYLKDARAERDAAIKRAEEAERRLEIANESILSQGRAMDVVEGNRFKAEEALAASQQREADLAKALEALAKVQYDGTVEGLREQIRTEDWGDVLDIEGTRAAYELTLAALQQPPVHGETK